jgi:hypothetical protein
MRRHPCYLHMYPSGLTETLAVTRCHVRMLGKVPEVQSRGVTSYLHGRSELGGCREKGLKAYLSTHPQSAKRLCDLDIYLQFLCKQEGRVNSHPILSPSSSVYGCGCTESMASLEELKVLCILETCRESKKEMIPICYRLVLLILRNP